MQVDAIQHIELREGPSGFKAVIAGHRIRVQDVVLWTRQGDSPEEIVARFPTLSLADVHAALSYYFDHRESIDSQIKADDELVQSLLKESPSSSGTQAS